MIVSWLIVKDSNIHKQGWGEVHHFVKHIIVLRIVLHGLRITSSVNIVNLQLHAFCYYLHFIHSILFYGYMTYSEYIRARIYLKISCEIKGEKSNKNDNERFVWSFRWVSHINHIAPVWDSFNGEAQALTKYFFKIIFNHISLINLSSLHPLLMASGCLSFIYFTLTMFPSDVHLSAIAKVQIGILLAQICGCYLEGTQQLCSTCQGIYLLGSAPSDSFK